jgi:putative flippase GtrA
MAGQVLRFALVGAVNTVTYYALYLTLRLVLPYLLAHAAAFVLSMTASFFLNCWYTYRTQPTWRKFLLFPLGNLTNFAVTTAGVYLLVDLLGTDERIAPLMAAGMAIPATFVVSRAVLHGSGPGRPAARWAPRLRRWRPGDRALAAALTALAFCVAGMVRRTYPFGPASRSVNDLGTQFVPQHAHLSDLLHGRAHGDLLLNWQSGFGVPYLPDFVTYLGNPLSLLAATFPRDRVDLAVFVITAMKLAAAAAAMTWYLSTLRRGPGWLAGALGAAYGLCGWAIDDGAYVPMWLDGLVAFPMLCLVAEWCRGRCRAALAVLVVAFLWTANFYTAYMATLGAGLVLVARVLADPDPAWRAKLVTLVRYAGTVLLGVALTAPLLVPTILAARAAQPSPPGHFTPLAPDRFLSRLLPLTEGVGRSPGLYVGTATLLLALTLPLSRSVPIRARAAWTLLAVLLTASLEWAPTHRMWHGFDTPNGSGFRQAFLVCGVLVILGWLVLAHRAPGPRSLAGGLAGLALLAAVSRGSPFLSTVSVPVLAGSAAATATALLVLRYSGGAGARIRPGFAPAAVTVLVATVLGESTWTAVTVDRERAERLAASPAWGAEHGALRAAATAAADWPNRRTDPGSALTANDPLLIGGEGAAYYSSLMPAAVTRTLTRLGFGWSGYGRAVQSLDNPVTDAIFSVGARLTRPDAPVVAGRPVPPLVTVRPPGQPPGGQGSPFERQEALLGTRVYDVPALGSSGTGGVAVATTPGPAHDAGSVLRLSGSCRPGAEVFVLAPRRKGQARLAGSGPWQQLLARTARPGTAHSARMLRLGRAGPDGSFGIELAPATSGPLPPSAVRCLDERRLAAAVAALTASGATTVRATGHRIDADLPAGSHGTAVVAVVRVDGWRCRRDQGAWVRPAGWGGLIAVPLDRPTAHVACRYRPPGLRPGLAVGAAAAATLAGAALAAAARRGRSAGRRAIGPAAEQA